MNCSPTLTADEFKEIHNGLYYLSCLNNEKVDEIVGRMRTALAGAYAQDDQAFSTRSRHYHEVKDSLGITDSEWSIYEVDDMGERHPFEGADRVVYRDHWGEYSVQCSVNGLTWAALWVAADACIRDSGDEHHVYIERFTPDKDDPRTLILTTGS